MHLTSATKIGEMKITLKWTFEWFKWIERHIQAWSFFEHKVNAAAVKGVMISSKWCSEIETGGIVYKKNEWIWWELRVKRLCDTDFENSYC